MSAFIYERKPALVEAFKYTKKDEKEFLEWLEAHEVDARKSGFVSGIFIQQRKPGVEHGFWSQAIVKKGDWVVINKDIVLQYTAKDFKRRYQMKMPKLDRREVMLMLIKETADVMPNDILQGIADKIMDMVK